MTLSLILDADGYAKPLVVKLALQENLPVRFLLVAMNYGIGQHLTNRQDKIFALLMIKPAWRKPASKRAPGRR